MKKIELLAPVGKIENAYAAVENGADAIFVGGKLFNARQYADNFTETELEEIIKYCKTRDVNVYVTLNTLIKQEEIQSVFDYIHQLQQLAPQAVIVQDFGLARIINEYFPNLTLHASTQMTAHSKEDVLFLKACGFKRVVLARELQLESIREIKEKTGVEIETFVHGALCYAYSGQCLLSSLIGSRSGNRGRCAQPCRMPYTLLKDHKEEINNLHLMSLKDMCALPLLEEILLAGVDSLKIEGRMKSPEYVASVVSSYRKAIDALEGEGLSKQEEKEEIEKMQSVFNRGGFSTGYYTQKRGGDMLTLDTPKNIGVPIGEVEHFNPKTKVATIFTTKALHPGDGLEIWNKKRHTGAGIEKEIPSQTSFKIQLKEYADNKAKVYLSKNHQLLKSLKKTYEKSTRRIPIELSFWGKAEKGMTLRLKYKDKEIEVVGKVPEKANAKPTPKELVQKQLEKMGNTPFVVHQSLIELEGECFFGISDLNELRRNAVSALEEMLCKHEQIQKPVYEGTSFKGSNLSPKYHAKVETMDQLEVVLRNKEISEVYWEWNYHTDRSFQAYRLCQEYKVKFKLALPPIMTDDIWRKYKDELICCKEEKMGFLIRTYGQYHFLKDVNTECMIDYTLNTMNQESLLHWIQKGASGVTLSLELSKKELQAFKGYGQRIIYGKMPTMLTNQCILGNTNRCIKNKQNQHLYELLDRKQEKWEIRTDCESCRMDLYTSKPMWIQKRVVEQLGLESYRFSFTNETKEEVQEVLEAFFKEKILNKEVYEEMFLKSVQ